MCCLFLRNVLENGFSEPMVLADSDRYDCAVCCLVADIDFDGQNEILLGTYGQVLTLKALNFLRKSWEPKGFSNLKSS